jgi:hypothetical protein
MLQGNSENFSLSRSNFRGVRHAYVPNNAALGRAGSSNLALLSLGMFSVEYYYSILTKGNRLGKNVYQVNLVTFVCFYDDICHWY